MYYILDIVQLYAMRCAKCTQNVFVYIFRPI